MRTGGTGETGVGWAVARTIAWPWAWTGQDDPVSPASSVPLQAERDQAMDGETNTYPEFAKPVLRVADPNTYIDGRSFDWVAYRQGENGERVFGAVGACGRLDQAVERVDEELAEYVTIAYAKITVTYHGRGPERQVVACAVRDLDGRISWTYP
jgi:hypothetical protein